jgi:hypothetical protein
LIVESNKNFRRRGKKLTRRKGTFYGLFPNGFWPLAAVTEHPHVLFAQGQ